MKRITLLLASTVLIFSNCRGKKEVNIPRIKVTNTPGDFQAFAKADNNGGIWIKKSEIIAVYQINSNVSGIVINGHSDVAVRGDATEIANVINQ